ncbi:putative Acetyltransferase, GNAT family [Bradyrhizobium sp. ORS 375]|uniref:GNAT family N-acetyltransferase n=1 Tax=Bradyrhizobium sp. (strain ORS 375) TaxID=566679 RepID=UPI00024075C4|nr:GNAT family N-acetyltransferase [Bradyrhizobium sp. ORS 375]CCD96813.1 putative Acetyltransferase, GNAT family [Bradyrhizobium sp. ORS 375]
MAIVLVPILDELPADFARLELDAAADGHANMARLSVEFARTPAMFHHVIAAHVGGALAGIGAITDEPAAAEHPAWRMRRLYVRRDFRRRRVAQTIVADLLRAAASKVVLVTVHTGSNVSARFWEAMGFDPVADRGWSHQRRP